MFKRYTGEEIHGFMFPDYNSKEPRWIDYKDYERACREANEREHATIVGLGRRIRELEEQCAAKDSVIATYESAEFGLSRSPDGSEVGVWKKGFPK